MPNPTFNNTCPFCKEKALRGTILQTFGEVPLNADGFDTAEANSNETEVDYVECGSCGETDLIQHYFFHDVFVDREYQHCDCVPEEEEENEHGEHSPETD